MKQLLKYFYVLFLCLPTLLVAQQIGNEWIELDQPYYRLPIPETGVYKITSTELQEAGIQPSNAQSIQLFQNGKEIPCYIKGESSGLAEYILFYAEKNSGWFDVEMYDDPDHQTNPYHSLISDTASVFLTWSSSISNKRFFLETDTNFDDYTPESYCWAEAYAEYTSSYFAALEDCEYVEAEGWFDNQILELGQTKTKNLPTHDFVNTGKTSQMEMAFISLSKSTGAFDNTHHIKITAPSFSFDTLFSGYRSIRVQRNLNITSLDTSTVFAFESIADQDAVSSKIAASYIKLRYTRGFNLLSRNELTFELPASSSKSYIELSSNSWETQNYLFDITNQKLISTVLNGNNLQALVPASATQNKMVLVNEANLKTTSIKATNFVNHQNKENDYLIITHSRLWESASIYANYRNAYLVNVNELYDQFGYGIQNHPMAIRNFIKYINREWNALPEHLFIIGKAVESYQIRYNRNAFDNCLVPTMGQYGSDVLLSAKVQNTGNIGAIATGRLAAMSNRDVLMYLNKVQEFEQNEVAEWMKHGIHFGGGKNANEQRNFKKYLKNYEKTFEDSLFGGYISTFYKTSSDPIVISKSDSIKNLVNNGLSIMTFFGHGSAANGFDQNIDEPSAYNNSEKYPLMIANSCYTGNIHLNGKVSKSEDWILIADKGAVGFFAVVGSGFADKLDILSGKVYENISNVYYGQTIGKSILEARKSMQFESNYDRIAKLTLQEFTLHGDPGIILNSFPKPDLKINSYDVSFIPPIVTTDIDSFYIQIIATNQARTTNKNVTVEFDHILPTGNEKNYFYEINGLKFKDTTRLKIGVDRVNGVGNNRFVISIDKYNKIDEGNNESNNTVEVNTFIKSSDLIPVIPYKYGFKRMDDKVLKASSIDVFAKDQSSIFQIDKSPNFNSPSLVTEEVQHAGGIIEWSPPVSMHKNETYFWRVANNNGENNWSYSSFSTDMIKQGWRQAHYGQISENNLKFIKKKDVNETFIFSDAPKVVRCTNIGSPTNGREIGYTVDGIGDYASVAGHNMHLVVIDSLTLVPWVSSRANFGHKNYPSGRSSRDDLYYVYSANSDASMRSLVETVENNVPDGNYILIYSYIAGYFSRWPGDVVQAFYEWGSESVGVIADDRYPYIFFARKGDPSFAFEEIGETITAEIKLEEQITTKFDYGFINTSLIGPATNWESFSWQSSMQENNNPDEQAQVSVIGIDQANSEVVLKEAITDNNLDISDIDANIYPYLKLEFFTKDYLYRTPSIIDYWEVLYEPVTDLAINYKTGNEFKSDILHEGEPGYLSIAFENIGRSDSDSTLVKYWIQNDSNRVISLESHKIPSIKAGESINDTVHFETLNREGDHSIWVELNPSLLPTEGKRLKEQYYFNNLASKSFAVKADETNPVLDVTFDGIHIMDGDLVSAKPEIIIQLKDENSFIALSDTSIFSVYLKSQNSGIEEKINLSTNPEIVFIPASLPKNKAQLIFNPTFSDDGIYELRVQAKDASGNESGAFDYLISFQVITESTITNVFNYPNPFSTATKFVFELTGSEIPDAMRIEVLTVTGKVIKVIYEHDLGPMRIGKNITEYTWDGRDMYGDPLANGVYFYRVNARIGGKELKVRDTGTGKYFKNGFGKMYIMR